MGETPTPGDGYDGNPVIRCAVEALRCFGDDLSREQAEMLLPMWKHYRELSTREVVAILNRFPRTPHLREHDGMKS